MTGELVVLAALAGIAIGGVLTVAAVMRLVRLARQPELARAPIAERSAVTFAEAGRAELAVEGPLFTSRFRSLGFELVDDAGMPVRLDRLWVRTSSGGFSTTRLSLHRVDVPHPGSYELRITGIDPAADYARCAVLFVRPYGPGLALTIVALIASVGLTAASFATAGVLLFGSPEREAPVAPAFEPRPRQVAVIDARGGRALRSDATRLAAAQEIEWPVLRMRVRVPAGWIVRRVTATELDLRDPTTPSTFLVGHATPIPAGPAFDDYLRAHVDHAREQLRAHLIEGYATRPIGAVPGVLTIEHRDDASAWMIAWTGFQPAEVGSLSVTLLAGAGATDFARDEPLLGAIVESLRFD